MRALIAGFKPIVWMLPMAVLAVVVGHFAAAWVGLLFYLVVLLLQHFFHAYYFSRLEQWSLNPQVDTGLEGRGRWDAVFSRLYRHEKKIRQQIALAEHEIAMLIAANQALTDGVVLLDADNHVLFCNKTAEMQLGLQMHSDQQQPLPNLVRQPEFVSYLQRGDFSAPLILHPERFRNSVYAIHIVPYAGNRRLMQVKDITQFDRLDKTRRDFIANVSHELRTPLTVLSGFVETLQSLDLTAEEQQRYLAMMAEQSARMQSIVHDLLALSTIESAPPPDNTVIDMRALLERLRRDAEALSAGRHRICLAESSAIGLRGSESELLSALGNLVSNAVRYTPDGGTITLRWCTTSQGGEFSVQDTGLGIEAKHLPRLTERFYRVDQGRSRAVGGTGLGLSIVKHSLVRHQAQLDIHSEVGEGSIFIARFPVSRLVK